MSVDHGRLHILVAEDFLHCPNVGDRSTTIGRNYFEWRFRSGHSTDPKIMVDRLGRNLRTRDGSIPSPGKPNDLITLSFICQRFSGRAYRNTLTAKHRTCIYKSPTNRIPDFKATFFRRQAVYTTPARKAPGLTSRERIILRRGLISYGQTSFF
jgi:hypothetical protein